MRSYNECPGTVSHGVCVVPSCLKPLLDKELFGHWIHQASPEDGCFQLSHRAAFPKTNHSGSPVEKYVDGTEMSCCTHSVWLKLCPDLYFSPTLWFNSCFFFCFWSSPSQKGLRTALLWSHLFGFLIQCVRNYLGILSKSFKMCGTQQKLLTFTIPVQASSRWIHGMSILDSFGIVQIYPLWIFTSV